MDPVPLIRSIQADYFRMLEGHLADVWAPFERYGGRIGAFAPRGGAHRPPHGQGRPPGRAPVDYTDRLRPLLQDVGAFWKQHAAALYGAVHVLPMAKIQIGDGEWDPWDYHHVLLRLGLSFDTILAFDPLSEAASPWEGAPERRFLAGERDTDRLIYAYVMLRSVARMALADTPLPLLVVMPHVQPARERMGLAAEGIDGLLLRLFSDIFSPDAPFLGFDDWSCHVADLDLSRLMSMVEAAPQLSGFFGGGRPSLADLLGRHRPERRGGGLYVPEEMFVAITLMFELLPSLWLLDFREAVAVHQRAAILVPSSHWALNRYRFQLEARIAEDEETQGLVTSTDLTWLGARTFDDLLALRRSGALGDIRQLTRSLLERASCDVEPREMEGALRRLASTLAERVGSAVPLQHQGRTLAAHPATFAVTCGPPRLRVSTGDAEPRPLALLDAVRGG